MGWCVRTEDAVPPGSAERALLAAGVDFNLSPRGRRNVVSTLGDIMDGVPARVLRERGIRRLHKEPVFVEVVGPLDATGRSPVAGDDAEPGTAAGPAPADSGSASGGDPEPEPREIAPLEDPSDSLEA